MISTSGYAYGGWHDQSPDALEARARDLIQEAKRLMDQAAQSRMSNVLGTLGRTGDGNMIGQHGWANAQHTGKLG